MLKVCIQSIRIFTVGDAGSLNVGKTLNIIQKKGNGEEVPDREAPSPEPTPPTTNPS